MLTNECTKHKHIWKHSSPKLMPAFETEILPPEFQYYISLKKNPYIQVDLLYPTTFSYVVSSLLQTVLANV